MELSNSESNQEFLERISSKLECPFITKEEIQNGQVYVVCTFMGKGIYATISSERAIAKNVLNHFQFIKDHKDSFLEGLRSQGLEVKVEDLFTALFKLENPSKYNSLLLMGREILKEEK